MSESAEGGRVEWPVEWVRLGLTSFGLAQGRERGPAVFPGTSRILRLAPAHRQEARSGFDPELAEGSNGCGNGTAKSPLPLLSRSMLNE